ncbi:peptidase [Nostoc sp. RF31YmG]|jgi:ATP-dependent protease ClpP protease subunit|nr:peptidase [Nostoc sp. RF31YmG]
MRNSTLHLAMCRILADAGTAPSLNLLQVRAAGDAAEVMIYGTIGESFWEESVSAAELAEQVAQIQAGTINVRINSAGGVAADGMAIYNALKQHPARKVVFIDGQACSIASLIAMAGDEVVMYASSLLMVHAPHTLAAGNAAAFRQWADVLDTHAAAMVEAYVAKTNKRTEIEQLLSDGVDHWYTGAQAVEFGFADRVADALPAQANARASAVALSSYAQTLTNAPPAPAKQLRAQVSAALSPQVFASLPEVTQAALIGHIEDPTMQNQYRAILAEGGTSSATPPATHTPAPTPAPVPVPIVAVGAEGQVQAALAALRTRNTEIMALAEPHMTNADVRSYVDGVIAAADPAVTADNVGRHILALMARNAQPLNGGAGITAGTDQRELTRAAMTNAIQARVGLAQPTEGNQFRGLTMIEMARAAVEAAGVSTRGMDRMQVVGLAFTHSNSDFPALLGTTANRAILQGYQEVEEQFDQFTRPVNVPDFKPTNLVGLGAFSNLDIVREGGEYKYGTFSEQSQSMRLVTYGKLFSITRQAIINDDLGVFNDVPRKMGQAAKRTLANAVFQLLTSNPTLADGYALFSVEHGNLLTGAAISTTSVSAMQAAMALQKDKDGHVIRVPMKSLLVPVALGGLARTVRASQFEVGAQRNNTTPNIVQNTFDVIEDGRLDANSAAAWYGVANPNFVDGIVVGYLDGNQTPFLDQHEGFTVDGVAWKVRLDAAPAIADYRGLYKNPGA